MHKQKFNKDTKIKTKRNDKKNTFNPKIEYLLISNKNQTNIKDHSTCIKIRQSICHNSACQMHKQHYMKIITNLIKHNSTKGSYETKIINNIIYDEKKHIVSLFKNHLIWDETADFLKRFYAIDESITRLPQIYAYYEEFSIFIPVYFSLNVAKIMLKNNKRKKKAMEIIEDQFNTRKQSKGIYFPNQIAVSFFINPEEVDLDKTTTAKTLSQSQLSYAIKKIAESDRFNNITYKNNKCTDNNINNNENEISLTEYNNNTIDGNDVNINDLINNISIQHIDHHTNRYQHENNNQNVKGNKNTLAVSNINFRSNSKAANKIGMKKLNFGAINTKNNYLPASMGNIKNQFPKCKTERIYQCKNNSKAFKLQKSNIPKPNNIMKPNKHCSTFRQSNNHLNSMKLLNIRKYNISALAHKMNSASQAKYYNKLNHSKSKSQSKSMTKRYQTQKGTKSTDGLISLRNQKLSLSNINHPKRIRPFIKENTTSSIYTTKQKHSKASHLDNSSITERKDYNYNNKETKYKTVLTPKSLIITKLTKRPSTKICLPSSGPIPKENIKVNLKCYPYHYIKPEISSLINTKYLINASKSKLTTTVNDYNQKSKGKTIKSYIENNRWNNNNSSATATERKDSQCNSRNSNTRHFHNIHQSSSLKVNRLIKKKPNQLKKPVNSPILPYRNIYKSNQIMNHKNKDTNKQTIVPTIISEIYNDYPLTSRNEMENVPFYIVNKLISKIIT